MTIHFDDQQLECVAEYARAVGRTAEDCLFEALDDWIRTVAAALVQKEPTNLAVIRLQSPPQPKTAYVC